MFKSIFSPWLIKYFISELSVSALFQMTSAKFAVLCFLAGLISLSGGSSSDEDEDRGLQVL